MSNGIERWVFGDTSIDLRAPGIISGQTGDLAQLFSSFANYAQGINSTLSTSIGGTFSINNIWGVGFTTAELMNVSFLGTYVVDLFNATDYQASGQGILSYGSNSSMFDFNITAYITAAAGGTPEYATMGSVFTVIDANAANNPGGSVSVPEPTTIAIFALALMLMFMKSQSSSLIQNKVIEVAITGIKIPKLTTFNVKKIFAANTNAANDDISIALAA
jgi:hypothetical protein